MPTTEGGRSAPGELHKKAIKRAGSPCPLPAQRKEDDEKDPAGTPLV